MNLAFVDELLKTLGDSIRKNAYINTEIPELVEYYLGDMFQKPSLVRIYNCNKVNKFDT